MIQFETKALPLWKRNSPSIGKTSNPKVSNMTLPIKTTAISLIGPRASGKTTYLATLSHFPDKKHLKDKLVGLDISYDKGSPTEKIARLAEDILKKGAKLAGTKRGDVTDLPDHLLRIKLPKMRGFHNSTLEIIFKDVAGEIFEDFSVEHRWTQAQAYINDFFTNLSWMIMLTDWQTSQDTHLYKPAFNNLYQEISEREKVNKEIRKLRIAVVLSKCERGELWPCRLEPEEDLFKVRLPTTYDFLRSKFPSRTNRLKFFACSSFGVLNAQHNDPRPNRYIPDDGSSADSTAFLRDPEKWQPFGLISPIYWLATGKVLNDPSL